MRDVWKWLTSLKNETNDSGFFYDFWDGGVWGGGSGPMWIPSSENETNTGRRALKIDPETGRLTEISNISATLSRIEYVFQNSCLNACHERISGQFEDAFKAAHQGCIVKRARSVSPIAYPTDVHPYESTGRKFETLWSTLEIREYWRDIQNVGIYPGFLPQPDYFSDDYWFKNGMADELRPLRDAVREFLKTIDVVKEYHFLLTAIIEGFLQESARKDRQELATAENEPIIHSFLALFDGRPVPILLRQLSEEFPEEDHVTLLIQGGYPYVLSELNRQLAPGSKFSEACDDDDYDSLNDLIFLHYSERLNEHLGVELGTWEQWTVARATAKCPIAEGRWEQDTIVPAALKLISVSNPSYDRSHARLNGNLTNAEKTILAWSLAQYNLMFLQGLLAKMADTIKGRLDCHFEDAPDTVKTQFQQTVQNCYQSAYETWKPDEMPESLDAPLPREPLLARVTTEIFHRYAFLDLYYALLEGATCYRHKKFDEAKKHFQEAIDFAHNILRESQFDATLWTDETRKNAALSQAEALHAIAYIDAKCGDNLEDAAERARQALKILPLTGTHHTLGFIYLQQGKVAAALEHLEQAKPELGSEPEFLLHLGDAYRDAGQHQQAKQEWQDGWERADDSDWKEQDGLTKFERTERAALRTELAERLGIPEQENAS